MNAELNAAMQLYDAMGGLYGIVFRALTVALLFMLIKAVTERMAGFIMFKLANPYMTVGTWVIVDGFEGYIEQITPISVIVRNENKIFFIATHRWTLQTWVVVLKQKGGESDGD